MFPKRNLILFHQISTGMSNLPPAGTVVSSIDLPHAITSHNLCSMLLCVNGELWCNITQVVHDSILVGQDDKQNMLKSVHSYRPLISDFDLFYIYSMDTLTLLRTIGRDVLLAEHQSIFGFNIANISSLTSSSTSSSEYVKICDIMNMTP